MALFSYCFGPRGRTVGPIVIKIEMVLFEVELVIYYKFEQNQMHQISVVPKKARIGPFFLTLLALAAERLGRL